MDTKQTRPPTKKTPFVPPLPKPKGIDDTFLARNQSKQIRLCFISSDSAIMDCTLLDFDKYGILVVQDGKTVYVLKHALALIQQLD